MPISSRWNTPIPEVPLPQWVFGSANGPLPDRNVFHDANDPSKKISFNEFRAYAKKIAIGLQKHGVQPGDRVLLFSGNELFVPPIFLGVIMAGAIFTGASPVFNTRELAYQLQDSGATIILSSTAVLDTAIKAANVIGLPHHKIFNFDGSPTPGPPVSGIAHWTTLLASDSAAAEFQWFEPADVRTATCCLNYSSGTTGKPKGVEITHYSYVANGESGVWQHKLQLEANGGPYDVSTMCFMPLYHAAAQTTYMVNAPKMGWRVYVMPAYNFDKLLQHLQNYRITELLTAPPIVSTLVTNSTVRGYDLSSIKHIQCGTAPLAPVLAQRASDLWPDPRVVVRQGWGMTEVTCVGTISDPRVSGVPTSVGEVVPNSTIKLMDGDREITEANQRGELWFSGPAVMKGYWRNPQATADTFVEENGTRWLKTGDIVYVDSYGPGGNVHIVDRVKEVIKVKGFQVAPAELEAVLSSRRDIVDVGVVGVEINGQEVPRAYIVKASGASASADDICKWMEGMVAPYKKLRGGVAFVSEIPRIPSGKILRRVLREKAKEELAHRAIGQPKLA